MSERYFDWVDNKNVLILGGTGMVGRALAKCLPDAHVIGSSDYDLTCPKQVRKMYEMHQPEYVFHLAAKVGGVKANSTQKADFYYQNCLINAHVLHYAHVCGVKKVLSLLSTCVYPNDIAYPMQEQNIHDGLPHESNYPYAFAKRMLDVQSRAYREQYGCNFITAIPNNLFGYHDQFHLEDSHVIPAIIHKTYLAKKEHKPLRLWGDGSPLREFTYAPDLARALCYLMEHYNAPDPINVGGSQVWSIKKVTELIAQYLDFTGPIEWDISQPMGQYQKPSCHKKMEALGWGEDKYTPFEEALLATCCWFEKRYPNVRGVKP